MNKWAYFLFHLRSASPCHLFAQWASASAAMCPKRGDNSAEPIGIWKSPGPLVNESRERADKSGLQRLSCRWAYFLFHLPLGMALQCIARQRCTALAASLQYVCSALWGSLAVLAAALAQASLLSSE